MRAGRTNRRADLSRRGFTLVEVVIALAISSAIGVTVAMMLGGISAATRAEHDTRRAIVKRQVAITRLGACVRGAAMVLSSADDHLVLWTGDSTGEGKPNISELRRIEWNDDSHEILVYEAPANLSAASDTEYELTNNFDSITQSLAGSASFPGRVRLRNVTHWDVNLDSPDPHAARAVKVALVVGSSSGSEQVLMTATMRATQP